jgi:Chromo (CHRromatin Organisation MOdifier) domain
MKLYGREDQVKLCPTQERSNGLVGFKTSEDKLSQEDGSKTRRTIQNRGGTGSLGLVTYQLKLLESWQIHKVFHATLLYPYQENKVYGENYIRPLPDIEEGEEVYEVEQILKHRKHEQGYEYLIKWVGYLITKASWEPNSNFTGATDILQEYQELHQL